MIASFNELVIYLIVFVKDRWIPLASAALLGLSIGMYTYVTEGQRYYSSMIVKSNYQSSRQLYNDVEYVNALIRQAKWGELSARFGMSIREAQTITQFEVQPIENEIDKAELYRRIFFDDQSREHEDTAWRKIIPYNQFAEQLGPYDYPFHEITLYSYSPEIFSKIQPNLIRFFNQNTTLQENKKWLDSVDRMEMKILSNSLDGVDSLRKAYSRRLSAPAMRVADGESNFVIPENQLRNPEVELFDRELMLKDELIQLQKSITGKWNVVTVYSNFNPVGTPVSIFRASFIKYGLYFLAGMFVILILIELTRQLNRLGVQTARNAEN